MELESMRYAATSSSSVHEEEEPKRKKYKKDAYFSDEEEFDDGWPKVTQSSVLMSWHILCSHLM